MRTLLLTSFMLCSFFSFSAIYEWKGQGTDYQKSSNWLPERNQRKKSDTLLFSEKAIIHNLVSDTIALAIIQNEMSISANEEVAWTFLKGIQIHKKAILRLEGAYAIQLQVEKSANAKIQGTLVFDGTKDLKHKLLGKQEKSIVFDSLSVCDIHNLNGNVFGSSGIKNVVIFKNGAKYWAKDGGNPFALTAPNSKVIFEETSIYIHEQGVSPSFAGRTYGKLIIDNNSVININFGSELKTTIYHLILKNGEIKIETSANKKALDFDVKQLEISQNASFLYNPTSLSTLELSSNTFPKNCTFGKNVILKIDSDSLVLENDLEIIGELILNGKVYTNSHQLILKNTEPNTFTYQSGFINGPFVRYISSNGVYEFPTGNNFVQKAILSLNDLQGVEYITCEFDNTSLDLEKEIVIGLDNIEEFLSNGYWKIEPNQQPIFGTYDIQLNALNFSNTLEGKDIRLVKRENEVENWKHLGVYQSDNYQHDTLSIQYTNFTSFSHFSIIIGEAIVLPMLLEKFEVTEQNQQLFFEWKMYTEEEGFYTLKESDDGQNYKEIGKIEATNQQSYFYESQEISTASYFQLFANDKLLKTFFMDKSNSFILYPIPILQGQNVFLFFQELTTTEIVICDLLGNEIYRKFVINQEQIEMPFLREGIYIIKAGKKSIKWAVLK